MASGADGEHDLRNSRIVVDRIAGQALDYAPGGLVIGIAS
jgi:hypothetical protein